MNRSKQWTRRVFTLLLPLALAFSIVVRAEGEELPLPEEPAEAPQSAEVPAAPEQQAGAEEGTLLFSRVRTYEGQFPDVGADSWFYVYAASGYEYGLFEGREDGFAPGAEIKLSELVTLSARLRAAYEGVEIRPQRDGEAWYDRYAEFLTDRALLDASLTELDVPATRAQLAGIFALSLPDACYDGRNADLVGRAYDSGEYIIDVEEDTPYRESILWLYSQGLLNGMDDSGSFLPEETTTRAETAALVTRIVDPSLRILLDWTVRPAWSAYGTTYASLIEAPESVSTAPSPSDDAAIDAVVRQMLASGANSFTLKYPRALTRADAVALSNAFSKAVKIYCEQQYNSVYCTTYAESGMTMLRFTATFLPETEFARLEDYRRETLDRAIEVHDQLWESGALHEGMTQKETAEVYFQWLCDNCIYDEAAMNNSSSIRHVAYSALLEGSAVCDGYTGAYNLFLKMEGIDCYALFNGDHIWTVATLDGTEYHIDTTWGDQGGWINWNCFCMTEEESRQLHNW